MKCILLRVSSLKDKFLLTSSHLVDLIIEKNLWETLDKIKNFIKLKMNEIHFNLDLKS